MGLFFPRERRKVMAAEHQNIQVRPRDWLTPVALVILREESFYGYELMERLEGVMNSAEKPHWDADSSVSSVLRRSPVFRISKPFLSKFITPSRVERLFLPLPTTSPLSPLSSFL